jgi:hypothetical protein
MSTAARNEALIVQAPAEMVIKVVWGLREIA